MRAVNEKIAAFEFAIRATKRFIIFHTLYFLAFDSVHLNRIVSLCPLMYVCMYIPRLSGRQANDSRTTNIGVRSKKTTVSFQKCFSIDDRHRRGDIDVGTSAG